MKAGQAFVHTVRHFFPDLRHWLDQFPDHRNPEYVVYDKRFLLLWGISLFVFQLGSRRQLDYQLRGGVGGGLSNPGEADGLKVLANLNPLAGTSHQTAPVNGTVDYLLDSKSPDALADLRTKMVRRVIRMKCLDGGRLLGRLVVVVDGTGWLVHHVKHCDACLVRAHASGILYMHQVLEAKVLGPNGMPLSIGTAFIENADRPDKPVADERTFKQDCELKAFDRLAVQLHRDFPQLRICLAGDALFACGRVLAAAAARDWSYVLSFVPGHMPSLWEEAQQLLDLCPENRLEVDEEGVRQVFRWVNDLEYTDSDGRDWKFNALYCSETEKGVTTEFSWITDLPLNAATVVEVAEKGGRARWCIENQGFNRQKNSGLQMEHEYSKDPDKQKAYYYFLQIAHILLVLMESGRVLQKMARTAGQTLQRLFGGLKYIGQRLLESVRFREWDTAAAEAAAAGAAAGDTS